MTGWLRLYITVEGQSEREFVKTVLGPHLAGFAIQVMPRVVVANSKHGMRGGVTSYARFRSDLIKTMRGDRSPDARFTTMIDFYRLPGDFPGRERARSRKGSVERVAFLEAALATDLGDARFIPHVQLHEFEALLYCDLSQLERRIAGSTRGIARLEAETVEFAPEEIDEGEATSPSKRIIKHVPLYAKNKVRVGGPAAAAIPLAGASHEVPPLRRLDRPTRGARPARLRPYPSSPSSCR